MGGRSYRGAGGEEGTLLGRWRHGLGCDSGNGEKKTDLKYILKVELGELADGLDEVPGETRRKMLPPWHTLMVAD